MSPVAPSTPLTTQAAILRAVAAEKYPKLALGPIAARYSVVFDELQALVRRHGYPDVAAMRRAADELVSRAAAADAAATTGDDVDEDNPAGTYTAVPVAQLHPDPDNPRDELHDIEDLAQSIQEVGLLQPIVVRRHSGRLLVVAGHRRLAAVKHLRWDKVQCIIRTDIRPDDVLAAMLIENGQRSDLDPIEEARGLRRLKAQLDCSDAELARRIGRSQPVVSSRLALLSLTVEEQAQVRAGGMTLVEATYKGRLNSGKVGKTGQDKNWHLGPSHDLADRAKARCNRLAHPGGRRIGGMACGACWESVIRADERDHLHELSAHLGKCTLCDHQLPQETTP